MLKKSKDKSSSKNMKSIKEIKYVDRNRGDKTFQEMSSTFAHTIHSKHKNTFSKSKCIKKIAKIIKNMEQETQTIKKICTEQYSKEKPLKKIKNNNMKTHSKKKLTNSMDKPIIELEHQEVEIDKIKQCYATTFGRETNNLIELYNFYKSFVENSKNQLFSSFSNSHNSVSINKIETKSENSCSKIMNSQLGNSQGLKKQEIYFDDIVTCKRQQSFKQEKIDLEQSKESISNTKKNTNGKNFTSGESINISHLLNQRRESFKNKNEQEIEKSNINLPLMVRKNKLANLKIQTNAKIELNKENIQERSKKQHKFEIFESDIQNKPINEVEEPVGYNKKSLPFIKYKIQVQESQLADKDLIKQISKIEDNTSKTQLTISKISRVNNQSVTQNIKQKKSLPIQINKIEKQIISQSNQKAKEHNNKNSNIKQTNKQRNQQQTDNCMETVIQIEKKEYKQKQVIIQPKQQIKDNKEKSLYLIYEQLKNKNSCSHIVQSNKIQNNYANICKNNSLSTTNNLLKKQEIINQQIQKPTIQFKTFIGNPIEQGSIKKFNSNNQNKNQIKQVQKKNNKEKENNQDLFEQIFKKNMFVNKIKQQINGKLKKQEKNYQQEQKYLEANKNPSLDQAILIENTQKSALIKNNEEFVEIVKQDLPLSKQDISLLEKLVTINNMISTNQLNIPQNKQNLLIQGLRIVNKKRGFTKSKFYVDEIPKHKKNKTPQIIEIQNLSPGVLNHPISIQKDESLIGCDISVVDERKQDSFLKNIEDIELDL